MNTARCGRKIKSNFLWSLFFCLHWNLPTILSNHSWWFWEPKRVLESSTLHQVHAGQAFYLLYKNSGAKGLFLTTAYKEILPGPDSTASKGLALHLFNLGSILAPIIVSCVCHLWSLSSKPWADSMALKQNKIEIAFEETYKFSHVTFFSQS